MTGLDLKWLRSNPSYTDSCKFILRIKKKAVPKVPFSFKMAILSRRAPPSTRGGLLGIRISLLAKYGF